MAASNDHGSYIHFQESELGSESETECDDNTDETRSTAGEEDDEKDEILPNDALNALAAEGEKLLDDMWLAAMVYPPSFDSFLGEMDYNRAPHLPCYDHTRVILKPTYGPVTYINASRVDGYSLKSAYIFAQAPFNVKTDSLFWRMVVQEKPQAIIVLGQIDEKQKRGEDEKYEINGRNFEKAFSSEFGAHNFAEAEKKIRMTRYFWPINMSDHSDYGANNAIGATNTGVFNDRHIDVHTLTVSEGREQPNSTVLVHFKDWLDDDPLPEFLNDMRASIKIHILRALKKPTAYTGPIMLVCPTGINRCGIYATIDIVVTRLTEEHTVGIKETMAAIKSQRYGCFRNLEHYKMVREMVMRFAISSGVVHDTAIGDKLPSVRKKAPKKPKKKLFNITKRKKLGK